MCAGLIRELERGALPGSSTWRTHIFQPGSQPLERLSSEIANFMSERSSDYEAQALYQRLRITPHEAALQFSTYLEAHPECNKVIWIIDQFEEVFTQCQSEQERSSFIDAIVSLVSAGDGRLSTVLTMQAAILSEVINRPDQVFRGLGLLISNNNLLVHPPDEDNLRAIMLEPAGMVGLEYEEGLVTIIQDDLRGQSGALPLLSHTLRELFERRQGKLLTIRSYNEVGGVEGSIARRADDVYEKFGPEARKVIRRVMVRLSQAAYRGDDPGEARQRILLKDLYSTGESRKLVDEVIITMASARLLTISGDEQTYGAWVEVAHEALIRKWVRLRDWLRDNKAVLRTFNKLSGDVREWKDKGRNEDLLYRGKVLAEASDLCGGPSGLLNEIALTEDELDFLRASQERERREQLNERRRRRVAKYLIASLTGVLLLGALALFAWRQRNAALSLSLASESYVAFDPEVSLLLAIEAVKLNPTKQTEAALRQAIVLPAVQSSLEGHTAQVITISPGRDNKRVITAGADNTARIWNHVTGELISTLTGHKDRVNSAVFNPDGTLVVTSSNDTTATIWDADSGKPLLTLIGHEGVVNNAVFSPDGNYVLTAGGDKTARIWDVKTGKESLKLTGHQDALNSAIFSPDGKYIVTASKDKTAMIFDAGTGQPVKTISEHRDSLLNAAFSSDGGWLATCSVDRTARVWRAGTWESVLELRGHSDNVNSVEFSPDGKWIVTGSKDGTARIWRTQTGQSAAELRGHRGGVNCAAFSFDGRFVFTASGDRTARVWVMDIPQSRAILSGHTDTVYTASFSPDGRLLVSASKDGTARFWDTGSGVETARLEHGSAVFNAVFSPDGKLIATASKDGKGRIWDAATGNIRRELEGHKCLQNSIAFSRDGRLVVTAGGSDGKCEKDNTARIWEVDSGKCLNTLAGHTDQVTSAVFSSDDSLIVTSSRDSTIRIWNARSGKSIDELRVGTGFVNSAVLSPDDKYIVAACGDSTTRIFDRGHNLLRILRSHDLWVNYAEFSPSGMLVATASGDKSVRIFEVNTGATLIQLSEHQESVFGASFSPDGRSLATASKDKTIRIYACSVCGATGQALVNLAVGRVRRGLTTQERERYLRLKEQ